MAWIEAAIARPSRRLVQPDGRIRLRSPVDDGVTTRVLRVILLDDGGTVHNAFLDRGYRE